jgi:hypothetical protein
MKFQFKGSNVEAVLDGAVLLEAGNVVLEMQRFVKSFDATNGQVSIEIDTSRLPDGSHFIHFDDYEDDASYPTSQQHTPFQVRNNRYLHFARDGSILDAYDPARSVLPISVFSTAQGAPTALEAVSMGLTQASFGGFFNPNDNIGWRAMGLDQWKQYQQNNYAAAFAKYAGNGLFLHHTFDGLFRQPQEADFWANCPWAQQAVDYAVSLMPLGTLWIDMLDECDGQAGVGTWNGNPYVCQYNTVNMGRKNVSWPAAAGSANAKDWDGQSDVLDIYWTEKSLRNTYGNTTSLYDRVMSARAVQQSRIDPTKPWVAISDLASEDPAWPVSNPGGCVLGELLHHVLVMGAAGVRLYAWSPAHPSWAEVRAAATIGCKWLQQSVASVLQPLLKPPTSYTWGIGSEWFAASRRQNMLTYINLADVPMPLECESFGNRYVISTAGVTAPVKVGDGDSLTVGPNQTVVYIR